MYGPEAGSTPLRPDMPLTTYGRKPALRARLAAQMQAHHDAGHSPVVMVRSSDYIGPHVRLSMFGDRTIEPLLAGKPAVR